MKFRTKQLTAFFTTFPPIPEKSNIFAYDSYHSAKVPEILEYAIYSTSIYESQIIGVVNSAGENKYLWTVYRLDRLRFTYT